jgi:uncharacterized repeat protein (TIGR01451 family)
MRISDNAGNVVTIDATGTVVFSGNASCTANVTCLTQISSSVPGQIFWQGRIGSFTISSEVGSTKPLVTPPVIDLQVHQLTTTSGGSITIQWTDTGFTAPGGTTGFMAGGGSFTANTSISYTGYMDNTNVPFGTGITVGTMGPFTTPSFAQNLNGPGATASPFSMTESVTFTMGPSVSAGGDFELDAVPNPVSGAIGDFVWQDTNHNGIQDAGEPGINGVVVKLASDSLCTNVLTSQPTTTFMGRDGYYQFTGLSAGTYYVCIDNNQGPLTNLVPTLTTQGGDTSVDSNPNPAQVILSTNSSVDETIDFGYTPKGTAALGDFVWVDANGNGLQDNGEVGIPGVKVNLYADASLTMLLGTTTTDGNGFYHFTGLFGGTYYVAVDASTLPSGFTPSPSQVGFPGNAAIDSNGSPAQVILPINTIDNTIDFGYVPPAQGAIGDFVWHDLNRDGIQDAGEPGINSVTVRLYDSGNNLVGTDTTHNFAGQDGYYQFTGLKAGTYTVVVDATTLPSGYTATLTGQGTTATDNNGSPATVTLPTNSSIDETIDFGYVSPCAGVIGDFVWHDTNLNGIQDSGEPGIPGVVLNLYGPGHVFITTTTTDSNGMYQFTGRCASTYTVEVVPPAGYSPTQSNAPGSTPANDSNGAPATVTLGIDETNLTIDFGYYKPAAIGDFVWEDLNANGQQDAGEPGIPGVSVSLYKCTGDVLAGTTTTDSNGLYSFTNLIPGCYYVKFATPSGYVAIVANTGNDASDSDSVGGQTGQYTLASGETNNTVDAGFYRPAALGDFVWEDLNANGQQDSGEPGIPNVIVSLFTCGNVPSGSTMTDGSGLYSFTNLAPGCYYVKFTTPAGYTPTTANSGPDVSDSDSAGGQTGQYTLTSGQTDNTVDAGFYKPAAIGDFVWDDKNGNGQQDAGEPGIPGVPVTLYKCSDTVTVVASTTTDGSGIYSFTGLVPGCYVVKFGTPSGYTPTTANSGPDTTDSDSVGGMTGNYNLASGETNNTVDAGFYKPAAIGDFVWNDQNGNGQQDAGEPGIPGVPVTLYKCSDTVTVIASTTTDGSGLYSFAGLVPGCYVVKFGTPSGYTPTTANSGPDTTDSDSVGGMTGNYNLASGETNNTVDAGFFIPPQLNVVKTPDGGSFTMGGQATFTIVVSNPAPAGAQAAKSVTLTDVLPGNGGLVWTSATTTAGTCTSPIVSNNLSCNLGDIAAGASVTVTVTTAATTPVAACQSQPNPAAIATATGGLTAQDSGSLTCTPPPAQLNVVKTPDGGSFTMGGQATFTIVVSNPAVAGSAAAKSVTLTDVLPGNGGLVWTTATTTAGTCTSPIVGNNLSCNLGDIAAGASVTVTVTTAATTPVAACQPQPNPAAIATATGGLTAQDSGSLTCTPPPAQLKVVKTPDNGSFTSGSQLTYTIVVSNPAAAGSASATNVSLSDQLPTNGGLTWTSSTTTQGTCTISGTYVLSCSLGTIAPQASATVTVSTPATTPAAACQSQPNPYANATATGGLTATDSGSLTCTSPTGQIGDFVWIDSNANGIQDAGEPGVPGVTLTLKNSGGTVIGTTTTDANGKYLFTGLTAGTYSVTMTMPFGYVATVTGKGTTATDSNLNPSTNIVLATNSSSDLTIDFGLVVPATNICGLTWGYWKNHVSLWPMTSMMLGNQTYSQSELQTILGTAVKGDVSIEMAHQLIAAKFNVANGTQISTANGAIAAADALLAQFTGKLPYNVAASSTVGAQIVSVAAQLDTFNSDGKAQPGCSTSGGTGPNASIGNFVWYDTNGNGIQDLGELGISGVTVRLRDSNNVLLKTTTTNANGQYDFTGLNAGAYIVELDTPSGYSPTTVGAAGSTSGNDSNPNPSIVVLPTNSSSDQTIDFGFKKTSCSGSIGDFVWKDTNGNGIQDAGEPGIAGVLVTLKNSSGTVLQTDITSLSGNYSFGGLCAGTYTVVVTTPGGYTPTTNTAGKDSTKDSNGSPATVTLATNTTADTSIDFGFKVVTSTATGFTTYTQGGWGAKPAGNNPGTLLQANFPNVYPTGVSIGSTLKLTFTSSVGVEGFLPQGGTPGILTMSASNPTTSAAGVLAGQVLALQLSVDFSTKGITKTGLGNLKIVSGIAAGQTVSQILSMANSILGGSMAVPAGYTLSDLVNVLDAINNNFDGGTVNKGYLQ